MARMVVSKKTKDNKYCENAEKRKFLHMGWWKWKLIQHWKTLQKFSKDKVEPPCDPVILPLVILEGDEIFHQRDTCAPVFIAVLLTTVKRQE